MKTLLAMTMFTCYIQAQTFPGPEVNGLHARCCGKKSQPPLGWGLDTRAFLAYEITDSDNGSQHFGGGIGARYYWEHVGLGAQTIQWSLADEALDELSIDVAWRQEVGPVEVVPLAGVGRNWEDENNYYFAGAEVHWWHLFAGARAVREEKEGWKAHLTTGINWRW